MDGICSKCGKLRVANRVFVGKPEGKKDEGSSPHLQQPATSACPEPDLSSPCPHIPLPEDSFQYYPPIYAWNLEATGKNFC
jgi:hypothetical protein